MRELLLLKGTRVLCFESGQPCGRHREFARGGLVSQGEGIIAPRFCTDGRGEGIIAPRFCTDGRGARCEMWVQATTLHIRGNVDATNDRYTTEPLARIINTRGSSSCSWRHPRGGLDAGVRK
eukprot:2976462-Pyramimonas_sp.AAC.1